ncbi:MAG: MerR family transcriptional regulator [Syntrophobacterales bacterium]|nr:MerR family transcriptional regulator [Syntrophobacterales bacterium]
MKKKEIFSISDFAKFARTTRDTLLHYDKIGLLSPVSRGDNNYRYYSNGQLGIFNMIRTLRTFGMSLAEIKRLKNNRTPTLVDMILDNQIKHLDERINNLLHTRKLLHLLKTTIHAQLDIDEKAITVEFRPAEAIVLGELNDYSRGRDDYDAMLSFYYDCHEKYPDFDLNYPVWGMFSEERIRRRDLVWPDRFYFYNPDGYDKKLAGLYVTGYARGGYGRTYGLYARLLDYIDANGLEICGPAYEEYPLNEICVLEEKNYLLRIMIMVREKKVKKTPETVKKQDNTLPQKLQRD